MVEDANNANQVNSSDAQQNSSKSGKSSKKLVWILIAVGIVIIVSGLLVYFLILKGNTRSPATSGEQTSGSSGETAGTQTTIQNPAGGATETADTSGAESTENSPEATGELAATVIGTQ